MCARACARAAMCVKGLERGRECEEGEFGGRERRSLTFGPTTRENARISDRFCRSLYLIKFYYILNTV